jgi:hypothetical protein
MKTYPEEQTTLIVHPGTGTIIDADECLILNTDDTGIAMEDDQIIEEAEANGDTLKGLHVVLVGNVFDGVTVVGPFLNVEDGCLWADNNTDQEWWVSSITPAEPATEYRAERLSNF